MKKKKKGEIRVVKKEVVTIKKRYKVYFGLNLISIFFIATSFIFTTFAWFAYSGLSNVATELDVKAWYIELTKSGEKVSNELVVSLSDIYPGMEPITELIDIENKGDSNAVVDYEIASARILGDDKDNYSINNTPSNDIEDILSHQYPFHINMNLSKRYLNSGGAKGSFEVSISWPLEAGQDNVDSEWGLKAYQFQELQKANKKINSQYKMKSSIEIVIKVTASQFTGKDMSNSYNFGDTVLYDIKNNTKCYELGGSCIKTTYLENKLTDDKDKVRLLPNIYDTYPIGNYDNYDNLYNQYVKDLTVETKQLTTEELIKIISNDINNSFIAGNNISNVIIGNTNKDTRVLELLNKTRKINAHFLFNKLSFPFLSTNKCIWTKNTSPVTLPFLIKNRDDKTIQGIQSEKIKECSVIPIIVVKKENLYSFIPE